MEKLKLVRSDLDNIKLHLDEHISSLAFPFDSYIEDTILSSDKYIINYDNMPSGYFTIKDNILITYHVHIDIYSKAPDILEHIIHKFKIETVILLSQDSQLNALLVEWNTTTERMGCFFTDSKNTIKNNSYLKDASFRYAVIEDTDIIHKVCGDFFDEPSCGYNTLDERICDNTIFILEKDNILYGCGIVEKSILMPGYVSIGMFTNQNYRNMGAAKTILLNLKKWAYGNNLIPIAGCWYYNTISRKSLESAGMIATSLGCHAKPISRDKPPKRTGNPPGILVE